MKLEFQAEAIKTTPAGGGTVIAWLTGDHFVATLTCLYIFMQMAYLGWKWNRERKENADTKQTT